jgi:hypothetical protein
MNNNDTSAINTLQKSHFVTAIACHTWFNFTKAQKLVVQVLEVQLREAELVKVELRAEVQLTDTSTNRRSRRGSLELNQEVPKSVVEMELASTPTKPTQTL